MSRLAAAAAAVFVLAGLAAAGRSECSDGTCRADDEEASALLQSKAVEAAKVNAHGRANASETPGCTTTPAKTCGNPSLYCVMDTTQCSSSGAGLCCQAAGNVDGMLQCRFCGEGTDCGPCTPSPAPTPSPPPPSPSPDFCGNTMQECQSCQVCLGAMKSYTCGGSCALNEACGAGQTPGSCPTCKERVATLVNNGMGVQDAMRSIASSYGWTTNGCQCLATIPAADCEYCGNTGHQCTAEEPVCVGGMKSYACAGPCANNPACGPGDTPGSCPTCADRVQTYVNNGMGVQQAMSSVGNSFGWTEPGCSCLK